MYKLRNLLIVVEVTSFFYERCLVANYWYQRLTILPQSSISTLLAQRGHALMLETHQPKHKHQKL